MKKYLIEFIGTFFLVLTVVMATTDPSISPLAPLAVASMYASMVLMGRHISGAHYNPAITFALLMRQKMDRTDALYYAVSQFGAAIVASMIGVFLHDCAHGPHILPRVNEQSFCAVLGEFLGVFILVFVYANKMSSTSEEEHLPDGLTLGLVALAASLTLGSLSGGFFNPASALGATVAGMLSFGDIWVYLIGALMGAAGAVTVIQFTNVKSDD